MGNMTSARSGARSGAPAAAAAEDRRAETRAPTARPARLFQGRFASDCVISNASPGGAKLTGVGKLPSSAPVLVIDLDGGVAYEGSVAWIAGGEMGVRFLANWDLRGAVPMWLRAAKGYWEQRQPVVAVA